MLRTKIISSLLFSIICLTAIYAQSQYWLYFPAIFAGEPSPPPIPALMTTIPVSWGPKDLAIDAVDNRIYVPYGHLMGIVRGLTHEVDISTGGYRGENIFDEPRQRLFLLRYYQNEVVVVEKEVITNVLPIFPNETGRITNMVLDPSNGWLYVVTSGWRNEEGISLRSRLTIFDAELNMVASIQSEHGSFRNIAIDSINQYVYIERTYTILEENSRRVDYLDVFKNAQKVYDIPINSSDLLTVDPQTGDVYSYACKLDVPHVTLLRQGEIVAQLGGIPDVRCVGLNMQVHPTTGDLYIIHLYGWVSVIRNEDDVLQVIGEPEAGYGAQKMAIDPLTGNVYIANFAADTVSVIQGIETVATIDVGWYPYGIAVHPETGWVYVSNTNDRTISVLGYPTE